MAKKIKKVKSMNYKPAHGVKSIGGLVTRNDASSMFKEHWAGATAEEFLYWDPQGFRTDGERVDLRTPMSELLMPAYKAYDECRMKGGGPEQAINEFREMSTKTLQTSTWNIPIHALPKVTIVIPGVLPLSNLIPRIATDKDSIQTTPLSSIGASSPIAEGTDTYTFTDDTYGNGDLSGKYLFDVKGYGRANKVSELMSLVGGAISNPMQNNARAQLISIRRFEEIQIFQGTNSGTGHSGNASSFKGIYDFAEDASAAAYNEDGSDGLTYPDDIRTMVQTLVSQGADHGSLVGATDAVTLTNIANALQDYVRTADPYKNYVVRGGDRNMDVLAVWIDGVPFFQSYGAPTTTAYREIICFDMSTQYMAMVQDATMKPLAKVDAYVQGATDAFGCMVSEGFAHVGRIYTIA